MDGPYQLIPDEKGGLKGNSNEEQTPQVFGQEDQYRQVDKGDQSPNQTGNQPGREFSASPDTVEDNQYDEGCRKGSRVGNPGTAVPSEQDRKQNKEYGGKEPDTQYGEPNDRTVNRAFVRFEKGCVLVGMVDKEPVHIHMELIAQSFKDQNVRDGLGPLPF